MTVHSMAIPASRSSAGASLFTMLSKGGPADVAAAAVTLSYMARGNKGRDVILTEGLVEPLIARALTAGEQ